MLGLIGGALGALLGIIGATFLPGVVGDPITISPTAMVGALVVALAIGISSASTRPAGRPTWLPSTLYETNSNRKEERDIPHADTDQPKHESPALGAIPRHRRDRARGRHDDRFGRRSRNDHHERPRLCQRQRRRTPGVEHGGAEPQHRPDHRQLDHLDAVLEDGVRVGQLTGGRRLRHRDRHAVEVVQDHDRRTQHHGPQPLVDGVLHFAGPRAVARRPAVHSPVPAASTSAGAAPAAARGPASPLVRLVGSPAA